MGLALGNQKGGGSLARRVVKGAIAEGKSSGILHVEISMLYCAIIVVLGRPLRDKECGAQPCFYFVFAGVGIDMVIGIE